MKASPPDPAYATGRLRRAAKARASRGELELERQSTRESLVTKQVELKRITVREEPRDLEELDDSIGSRFGHVACRSETDATGKVAGRVEAISDITEVESKHAEQALQRAHDDLERRVVERTAELTTALDALRASETKFRLFVESAPDATVIADEKGRMVLVNAQAERLFGYARKELEGRSVELLMPRRFRRRFRSRRELYFGGARVHQVESELPLCGMRKDGGEFPVEIKFSPLRTPDGVLVCAAIRDVTERQRAEEALRQSKEHYLALFQHARAAREEAQRVSSLVLQAQEFERKRISRELHDDVGQTLQVIGMSVAALKKVVKQGSAPESSHLEAMQRMVERAMESVHNFARELRPSMLDELGLLPALRSHLKDVAAQTGLCVNLQADPCAEQLGAEEKLVLFRVAQESLNNVVKHAEASHVDVAVCPFDGNIVMSVADNGKSFRFDPHGAAWSQRLGIVGMRERVRLVNGQFRILPRPGKGTRVRVTIPLKPV